MTPHCGLAKEDCVSNQTLKDESCLVPCSGLYADVADDSRFQENQQDMLKGISLGLAMYSKKVDDELAHGRHKTAVDEEQLQKVLQQMISSQADPEDGGFRLSMGEYIKYKERYVKHLQFNPNIQNLSKCLISPTLL